MRCESPADFCAKYTEAHRHEETDELGTSSTLHEVTVVKVTSDTARVEALWYRCGHAPDAGFYDVLERTAFVLVKRHDVSALPTVPAPDQVCRRRLAGEASPCHP
jgi:hypothetical protein